MKSRICCIAQARFRRSIDNRKSTLRNSYITIEEYVELRDLTNNNIADVSATKA